MPSNIIQGTITFLHKLVGEGTSGSQASSGPTWLKGGNPAISDPTVVDPQQAAQRYKYLAQGQAEFMQKRAQEMEAARQQKEYSSAQGGGDSETSKFQKSSLGLLTKLAGPLALAGLLAQSKIVGTVFGTITKLLGALIDVILAPFIPIIVPLLKFLGSMVKDVADFIQDVKEKGWVKAIVSYFKAAIMGGDWSKIVLAIAAALGGTWLADKLLSILSQGKIDLINWGKLIEKLGETIGKVTDWAWEKIQDNIGDKITAAKDWAWETLIEPVYKSITDAVGLEWSKIVDKIGKGINITKETWNNIIDFIKPHLTKGMEAVIGIGKTIVTAIAGTIKDTGGWVWEQIIEPIQKAVASLATRTLGSSSWIGLALATITTVYLLSQNYIEKTKVEREQIRDLYKQNPALFTDADITELRKFFRGEFPGKYGYNPTPSEYQQKHQGEWGIAPLDVSNAEFLEWLISEKGFMSNMMDTMPWNHPLRDALRMLEDIINERLLHPVDTAQAIALASVNEGPDRTTSGDNRLGLAR